MFNFFLPDYRPPGELANLGLAAPEFQITTDTTIASVAGALGAKVFWAWRGNPGSSSEDILVDLAPELPVAADPRRLVDRYDLLFMARTMSPFMFDTLVTYLATFRTRTMAAVPRAERGVADPEFPEYAIER